MCYRSFGIVNKKYLFIVGLVWIGTTNNFDYNQKTALSISTPSSFFFRKNIHLNKVSIIDEKLH